MVDTFDFIVNKYKINLDGRYIIDIPNMAWKVYSRKRDSRIFQYDLATDIFTR